MTRLGASRAAMSLSLCQYILRRHKARSDTKPLVAVTKWFITLADIHISPRA